MKWHPRTRRLVSGVDTTVYVDLAPLPAFAGRAFGWAWLSETRIGGPAETFEGWRPLVYDLTTQRLDILDPDGPLNNCNSFGASPSGVWAYAGTAPFGVRSSLWPGTRGAVLHTVTRDSWVIYGEDNSGQGLVYARGGVHTAIPGAAFVAAEDAVLLYRQDGSLWQRDMWTGAITPVRGDAGRVWTLSTLGPDVYLLSWLRGAFVLMRADDLAQGWIVSTGRNDFNPDLIDVSPTTFAIVSSAGAGERPHETQTYEVDISTPRVFLATIDAVLPSLDAVPRLGRAMTLGVFAFNDVAVSTLGNVTLPVRPTRFPSRPVIVALADLDRYPRRDVFALWAAEGGTEKLTLEQALDRARLAATHLGVVGYADTFGRGFVPTLRAGEVYSEPFYRDPAESLVAYTNRCENRYADVAVSRRFWPSVNAYTRGWTLTDRQAVESFVAIAGLMARQDWHGALLFAAGRVGQDGRPDLPVVLVPYLERLAGGLTGPVPLLVVAPVEPVIVQPVDPVVVVPPIEGPRPLFAPLRRYQGVPMSTINLIGPSGRYLNIDPALPVGGTVAGRPNAVLQANLEDLGHENAAVTIEPIMVDGNQKYLLIAVKQSEVAGYPVVLSFPDSPGAVQTRPKDQANAGADEGVSLFTMPDGKQHVAMNVHTKRDGAIVFYPTTFTVVEVAA